jgi:HAMP domain-containing protein
MSFWENFWEIFWWFFFIYAFFAFLWALFAVFGDLFRDHTLSGWWKVVWVLFLVFVPILGVLVYVIARGKGMAERSMERARSHMEASDAYIRSVTAPSPTDEISKAKALLDSGTISADEYERIKSKALI